MINRRNFMRTTGMLTIGSLIAGNPKQGLSSTTKVAPSVKKIGLQTYSLGEEFTKDIPEGFKKIKKIGYSTLELANYNYENGLFYGYLPKELKKIAEDNGLELISSHTNPPTRDFSKENHKKIYEFWKKAGDDHSKLGVKYLVQAGEPISDNHDQVSGVCEVFNKAGEIAKSLGLLFGYHNHAEEFLRIRKPDQEVGDRVYDLYLRDTDKSFVFFELDVYWMVMGRNDPVDYLQRFADRFLLLHIKDRAVLGRSGMMNFETIFEQAYKNGTLKEYFVELEPSWMPKGMTQLEGIEACCTYLQKASFVK